MKPFANAEVKTVFENYPEDVRHALLRLRETIFDVAAKTDGVGQLEETLKWGQPSYLTPETRNGTTVRISDVRSSPSKYGIFVHCQTSLVATYREMYSDFLIFDGNRGIMLSTDKEPPEDVVRHCIELALTYHQRK